MENDYDLLVIGTGSAGTSAATECASAGWRVAIADERPFGGTCLLRGCDPKKVLVGAAELEDWARRMRDSGVVTGALNIDWPGLMRFKRTFTDPAPAQREREYKEAGITCLHGTVQFLSPRDVRIGEVETAPRHIVVAAGAKPISLGLPGEHLLKTSEDFLSMDKLPQRIVMVGGGFIAFEFAHVAARCGASVRILEGESTPLRGFDPDLVERLVTATRELGIEVLLDTKVTAFEDLGGEIVVRAQSKDQAHAFACDAAIHGGGRTADLDALHLEAGAVERTKKGVKVNEYLQSTSNLSVYAAGDAADAGGAPLTPVAGAQGELVARNMLHGNTDRMDYSGLVSIVYTIPALAQVGLSEQAARARNVPFDVHTGDMTQWYSSRRLAAKTGAYKVLTQRGTGQILGAHILGPHAEEVANIFCLSIRANVPVHVLKDALFGYPTGASDIAYML